MAAMRPQKTPCLRTPASDKQLGLPEIPFGIELALLTSSLLVPFASPLNSGRLFERAHSQTISLRYSFRIDSGIPELSVLL